MVLGDNQTDPTSLEGKISEETLGKIGVHISRDTGRYMAGTGFGSIVSKTDVDKAVQGYDLLTDLMKETYGDRERFWLSVAAADNPDLLKDMKQVPAPDGLSIDAILNAVPQDEQSAAQRQINTRIAGSAETTYANLKLAYQSAVETVVSYIARNKGQRDLRTALKLALVAETIGTSMRQYQKLLSPQPKAAVGTYTPTR